MDNYNPPGALLKDRVILVTGASQGIGAVAAKTFAGYGATCLLLARHRGKLESVYDEIREAGAPEPAIYPFNLMTATPDDYIQLGEHIEKHFGRLDGILHNAAQLGTLTPLELYTTPLWYQVFQTNLHSLFLLTKSCVPLLKKGNQPSVLITSHVTGKQGKAYWGAYGICNAARESYMQILSQELENTDIRVNAIRPSPVRTKMRATAYPAENPELNPLPETLMKQYLYLMGPESVGVRGEVIDCHPE